MGRINWQTPELTAFFIQVYQWLAWGPFLFVLMCVCAWGLLQLATTSGQRGVVPFLAAPAAILLIFALPSMFPVLGSGG